MAGLYRYFVEGECEASLLYALMHSEDERYRIYPGKIEVLNVLYDRISQTKARTFKKDTRIVFVFDTDVNKTSILEDNIDIVCNYSCIDISNILFIQSCRNFEDEIVHSCSDISNIKDLFGTKTIEDFKKKFIKHKDILSKLISVGFDINKIWSISPKEPFICYKQGFNDIRMPK